MRTLLSFAVLISAAMPAFARDLPEPGSIGLLVIGTAAMVAAIRKRK